MSVFDEMRGKLDLARRRAMAPYERVAEEVYEQRLKECHSCPSFLTKTGQCQHCLCFMSQKAKLTGSSCPEKRWLSCIPKYEQ